MLTIDLKPSNHNPQRIKMMPTPSAFSLNRGQRIKELTRVTQENKLLLQRLQTASSVYNNKKWERDFKAKQYMVGMLSKNSDRYCQHPYFLMSSEPRIMSATGTHKFGYQTMPFHFGQRAKSSYSASRKGKKRRRIMTAGHGGRKRSAVADGTNKNRPITAKGPNIGRFGRQERPKPTTKENANRPETVPFTNLGPLGETEPMEEDDERKNEINRQIIGESEHDIEARINDDDNIDNNDNDQNNESDHRDHSPDKYNEPEKKFDNFTEEGSNKHGRNNDDNNSSNDNKENQSENEQPASSSEQHDMKNSSNLNIKPSESSER